MSPPGDEESKFDCAVDEVEVVHDLPTEIIPRVSCPKTDAVRKAIVDEGNKLRRDYPFLVTFQSWIGFAILMGSAAGIAALIYYSYAFQDKLPYWVVFVGVAFLSSVVHEVEHDTIHDAYFRHLPLVQDFMFFVTLLCRPNMINSWSRRVIHLHHHLTSGTFSDVEEQAISNGMPLGWRRLLILLDPAMNAVVRRGHVREAAIEMMKMHKEIPDHRKRSVFSRITLPFNIIHHALLLAFVVGKLVTAVLVPYVLGGPGSAAAGYIDVFASNAYAARAIHFTSAYLFVLGFPNMFRMTCLMISSSFCHYFGDVEIGNVLMQTQVIDAWWTWPLALFCARFSATHCLHHLVLRDPFYIREWISRRCYPAMRAAGIRFNDVGSFFRANRYWPAKDAKKD